MAQRPIVIFGGTGAYFLDLASELGPGEMRLIDTPFGQAGPMFLPARFAGRIVLASRHGRGRLEVTPPFVNSRASVAAARALGCQAILSWNGVGAINPLLEVHDLLVLDGLIDMTKTRARDWDDTLAPPPPLPPVQQPFAAGPAAALFAAARQAQPRAFPVGTYVCTEGPRLETAAEIAAFGRLGADVVGMTLGPEALLAAAAGVPMAALAYVTNYATGVEPAAGAPRFFGVEVARLCLHLVLATATDLLEAA